MGRTSSEHAYLAPPESGHQLPVLALPFTRDAQVSSKHQRAEILFSKTSSAKALEACKAINTTITHVLHAVIPVAMKELLNHLNHEKHIQYANDILCNMRATCSAPHNTEDPIAVYHTGSTTGLAVEMVVPEESSSAPSKEFQKEEFLSVLGQVQILYHSVRDDEDLSHLTPHLYGAKAAALPDPVEALPPGRTPKPIPSVALSSLGRVDSLIPPRLGDLEMARPWVTGEGLSNVYGLFLISHGGGMSLSSAYNEA